MFSDSFNETVGRRYPVWRIIETLRRINATSSAVDLLQSVIQEACYLSGIEKASAILWDSDSGCYRLKATTHTAHDEEHAITLTRDEAFGRYLHDVMEVHEGIYLITEVAGRPGQEKILPLGIPLSMLVMPIPINGSVEGFLIFDNMTRRDAFEAEELRVLHMLREPFLSALIKIQMIEQLQSLNRDKSDFLHLVAHDIRNPVHAIMGCSEMLLLEESCRDPESLRSDLEIIHASARRIMQLVTELMDVAMLESTAHLAMEDTDLFALVRQCLESLRPAAERKGIRLAGPEPEHCPPIRFNPAAIRQVVENLLSNALKYTFDGGEVRVRIERCGAAIVVHVEDTGQGLSKEDLGYVFKAVRKLSARPTGQESSTGLGLVLVRRIVEKHGGRIWVESIQGKGSTFSFSLPLRPSPETATESGTPSFRASPLATGSCDRP